VGSNFDFKGLVDRLNRAFPSLLSARDGTGEIIVMDGEDKGHG